jgi:hypothetical protein
MTPRQSKNNVDLAGRVLLLHGRGDETCCWNTHNIFYTTVAYRQKATGDDPLDASDPEIIFTECLLSFSFGESTPPHNLHLIVYYYNLKYRVGVFVGELTSENLSINTFCQIRAHLSSGILVD